MRQLKVAQAQEVAILPEHLEKRLSGYALAAAAAGVGLALASDAKADIIQISSAQSFNAGQIWDVAETTGYPYTDQFAGALALRSGTLLATSTFFLFKTWASVRAFASLYGRSGGKIGADNFFGGSLAGFLPAGIPVSRAVFADRIQLGLAVASETYWTIFGGGAGEHYVKVGPLTASTSRKSAGYLGFKFPNGELGWAKVDVEARASFRYLPFYGNFVAVEGTIGPVYEGSCGSQPLLTGETSCAPPTPEPSSITLLALGALGMLALRRKRCANELAASSGAER
jgi:hypothetical protein